MSRLLRRLAGDNRPTEYWTVSWSQDSDKTAGVYQYFVGPSPDAEQEAREFASQLSVDPKRGYIRVREVTP